MTLPSGTTKEGDRLVVMTEEVFDMLVEHMAEATGKDWTVDFGEMKSGTIAFYAPTIYEGYDPEDVDPLTVGQ